MTFKIPKLFFWIATIGASFFSQSFITWPCRSVTFNADNFISVWTVLDEWSQTMNHALMFLRYASPRLALPMQCKMLSRSAHTVLPLGHA